MPNSINRTELSPVSFLERSALVFPDKVAVVHYARRYTYGELAKRVNRLASRLRAGGLQKGDRVAFLAPNTPALLEAHFGVPAAGGVLVAINTRLVAPEIDYVLKHAGCKFLFVDAELASPLDALALGEIQVVRMTDTGAPEDPYEMFLAEGSPEEVESWLTDENETIAIDYTSGTTGKPKGVMYSHRSAYLAALAQCIEVRLTADSVYLWTLPMFHCNGWCYNWAVTAVAATHVCLRKIDPGVIWELLEGEHVTHFNAAPTVNIFLVNHPNAHRVAQPVTVAVGGAPPSPTLLNQMRALNLHPIHLYGLTETYGPYVVCEWHREWDALPSDEQARLLARQGVANVAAERVRVVDESANDVPRDGVTLGEVVMRGNLVMQGYYKNKEATERAFQGGWFHTGDLAVWHPDGYVELRDRAKDIIISGGENISSIEVEQVIMQHPMVMECCVVAIPDETWGERPKAFVTLKQNQMLSETDLIEFCRQRLAHFKCPAAVEFGDLPKTSTGKVQKYVLRERERRNR